MTLSTNIKASTDIVRQYYQQLFSDKQKPSATIYDYCQKNNFSKLTEQQRQLTNASLIAMELTEAISKQKKSKTPGPDGIPAKFYKKLFYLTN